MEKEELIAFETELKELWEEGKIKCPLHLSGGNEEQLIDIFKEVGYDDILFSTHRNHYHALLHGVPAEALRKEVLRAEDGLASGNSGSMCTASRLRNFYSSAIVGGNCAPAVGAGYAIQEHKGLERVWCFIGDGAVDTGHFWEALRYTQGWNLPVTFVIEDNDRSTCTSIKERWGELGLAGVEEMENVRYYSYEPTYPHVGSGVYVQF